MIKLFSVYDILSLPQFSHHSQFTLVEKENDSAIGEALFPVGLDNNKDIEVFACKHRRVDGSMAVGYVYSGFERKDKEWMDSPYCSMDARIDAQKDGDLKAELIRLSHTSGIMQFKEDETAITKYMREITVETYEEDRSIINALNDILENIRK